MFSSQVTKKIFFTKNNLISLNQELEIVRANMLFIPKKGISQKALNHIKRLAAFKNLEFHKAQAMRLPVREIPRIISCSVLNEMRNQLIIDDVVKSHENGRNCVILTQRTAHVDLLTNELTKRIPDVISAKSCSSKNINV